jgi:hypothetical protein
MKMASVCRRKPMAVIANASQRSYAMAAEDTNKGVVGPILLMILDVPC